MRLPLAFICGQTRLSPPPGVGMHGCGYLVVPLTKACRTLSLFRSGTRTTTV